MTFFSRQTQRRGSHQPDSSLVGWLGAADVWGRFVVLGVLALAYAFVLETSVVAFLSNEHWWGLTTDPENPSLIVQVEPNGLAWDSSVRPGDVIVFDQGQPAPTNPTALNTSSRLQVRSHSEPGMIIVLGEPSLGDRFGILGLAAVGLVFVLAGALVYAQSTTRRQARAFASTCAVAALALTVYPAGVIGQPWAIRLTFVCFTLIPTLFAFLFFVFPVDHMNRPLIRRHLLRTLTLLALGTLLLYAVALGGYWPAFSYAERASEINMIAGISIGLAVLLRSYFSYCTPRAKQQLRIAVTGTLLGIWPFLVFSILPLAFRPLQPADVSLQPYLVSPGITVLATIFIPLSFGYAILKHQLIQADVVIRRSVIYLAVTLVTVTCYLLTVSAFTGLVQSLTHEESVITLVLAAFVVALIAEPIRRTTQSWVERVFFTDVLAYRQLLNTSSVVLNSILNPSEIFTLIFGTISSALPVSHMTLFVLDREKHEFHVRWDQHGEQITGPTLGPDHPFVRMVENHRQPVLLTAQHPELFVSTPGRAGRLPEPQPRQVLAAGSMNGSATKPKNGSATGTATGPTTGMPHVLVPFRTGGEVIAILALGPRADEETYAGADLEFLALVEIRFAVALDNALLHETVRNQADTDALTGIYNHRYLHARLNQEIVLARERNQPLGVLMMDVDSFKFFNDTYGHPIGDQVLVTVSRLLREVCHDFGIVGRYGGDEFVVILPKHDRAAAEQIAKQIDASIQELLFHVGSPALRDDDTPPREVLSLSLTIGVAAMPEHGETSSQLISAADVSMYGHKRAPSEGARTLPDMGDLPPGPLRVVMVAVQQKDGYIASHSERAAHWAVRLASALGLSEREQQIIRLAGLLHDIGKLGISEKILNKVGKLTTEERRLMEAHVDLSVALIADAPNKEAVIAAIRHHHERWDGAGYPRGIAGEAIPISGRILAVADVYSALTTDRAYRHRMTSEGAADWIRSQAGTQFDVRVVNALTSVLSSSEEFQLPAREERKSPEASSPPVAQRPSRATAYASRRGQVRSPAGPRSEGRP